MANGFNSENEGAGNHHVGYMNDPRMRVWASESEKRLGPMLRHHTMPCTKTTLRLKTAAMVV